jgi:hypothetical protein
MSKRKPLRVVEFAKLVARDLPNHPEHKRPDFEWATILIGEPRDPDEKRHIVQIDVSNVPEGVASAEWMPEVVRVSAEPFPPLAEAVLVLPVWAVDRMTWEAIGAVAGEWAGALDKHPDRYEALHVLHAWRDTKSKPHVAAWAGAVTRHETLPPVLGKWDVTRAIGPTAEAVKGLVA